MLGHPNQSHRLMMFVMKKLSVRSFLKLCVSLICAQDNLDSLISSKSKKSTARIVSVFVCVYERKLVFGV